MDHIFFFYFAAVIVATSLLVVALRNPVYSALSLLIMFFHVAGLYVTLHAEFLAAVQIVVYAGAAGAVLDESGQVVDPGRRIVPSVEHERENTTGAQHATGLDERVELDPRQQMGARHG